MMGFTAEDNFAKTAEKIFYLNDTNINNLFPFSQKNIYYISWILEVMDIRRILKSYEVSDDIYIYIRPV